ncbi:hypothetical protein D9758_012359 [Tetrapyrgos nigripes]|uniref:Uncharacterized protein n=1 Tax=Tetrapyrgos nigripes TaxID=182062 RepID=A0A8H5CMN1_9AGAR|nr:hypothetical protein D9758_012359 [Tetrapyrgos nigripes]
MSRMDKDSVTKFPPSSSFPELPPELWILIFSFATRLPRYPMLFRREDATKSQSKRYQASSVTKRHLIVSKTRISLLAAPFLYEHLMLINFQTLPIPNMKAIMDCVPAASIIAFDAGDMYSSDYVTMPPALHKVAPPVHVLNWHLSFASIFLAKFKLPFPNIVNLTSLQLCWLWSDISNPALASSPNPQFQKVRLHH